MKNYKSYFSISLSVLYSLLFIYGCSSNEYETKKLDKGELYYDRNISQDKVETLGNFINQCAIFNDEVQKARLTKSDSTYELSLSVPADMYNSDQYQNYAEILAMQLSDDVFDHSKVDIHLTDSNFNTKVTKSSEH
ncbi:MAG TPA: hypothetical protein VKD08_06650 [Ignavibacteriaceae bacterium]|nr:hypothetical protein [Ignavibacteriaceae bacterium]